VCGSGGFWERKLLGISEEVGVVFSSVLGSGWEELREKILIRGVGAG